MTMPQIRAAASATIDAPPQKIYSILADYRNGHPKILPKQFTRLEVERGGRGAGTLLLVEMRSLGGTRSIRMEVSEPEPGRRLVETDLDSGLVTTFTVVPQKNGRSASVSIVTEWDSQGVRGWIERLFAPSMLQKIYSEELRNLARVARSDMKSGMLV
jgi:uncharacterized protein YndB with AHSA1/START domain